LPPCRSLDFNHSLLPSVLIRQYITRTVKALILKSPIIRTVIILRLGHYFRRQQICPSINCRPRATLMMLFPTRHKWESNPSNVPLAVVLVAQQIRITTEYLRFLLL
jgi:hypothetical protein